MARICKVLGVLFLHLLVSCGGTGDADATSVPPATARPTGCGNGGDITVAAAASLTEPFEAIGAEIEASCPGASVTFTFDSSATLAAQIGEGAPVDVFAPADETNATEVSGLATGPAEVFARNRLVIVTKPGNPAQITSLADLRGAGVVALCAADAPCGTFAAEVLTAAEVTLDESQVTRGQNARATLTAVAEGDAVAGIVYATDAEAATGAVQDVGIPADQNVVVTYPVVVMDGPGDPGLATAFAAALLEDEAQHELAARGFLPPR